MLRLKENIEIEMDSSSKQNESSSSMEKKESFLIKEDVDLSLKENEIFNLNENDDSKKYVLLNDEITIMKDKIKNIMQSIQTLEINLNDYHERVFESYENDMNKIRKNLSRLDRYCEERFEHSRNLVSSVNNQMKQEILEEIKNITESLKTEVSMMKETVEDNQLRVQVIFRYWNKELINKGLH